MYNNCQTPLRTKMVLSSTPCVFSNTPPTGPSFIYETTARTKVGLRSSVCRYHASTTPPPEGTTQRTHSARTQYMSESSIHHIPVPCWRAVHHGRRKPSRPRRGQSTHTFQLEATREALRTPRPWTQSKDGWCTPRYRCRRATVQQRNPSAQPFAWSWA